MNRHEEELPATNEEIEALFDDDGGLAERQLLRRRVNRWLEEGDGAFADYEGEEE